MKRDIAEKAETLLKLMREHESLDQKIRDTYKLAKTGNQESLDKLTNVCLELNEQVKRHLEENLAAL
ncbi:hypothetical protein [Cellvibrio sp. QJXJ]|uniref:hypothetical protein n=1 Tax=Cellvibrio sp. QJXJ TaxID=2964606 RepID=UPI0021C293C5|nr:hypothetical protein [Cellvibrio sp. QJXJ]UUA74279.1 hypothetical protein NNX04_07510 [Cellvibrio sp. QJXJ]